MTGSIFDPTGGETEHSGNMNMGPSADNNSHLPPGIVDGLVTDEEVAEHDALSAAEAETVAPPRDAAELGTQSTDASVSPHHA